MHTERRAYRKAKSLPQWPSTHAAIQARIVPRLRCERSHVVLMSARAPVRDVPMMFDWLTY